MKLSWIYIFFIVNYSQCLPVKEYLEQRNKLQQAELDRFLGSNITLDSKEQQVNQILMKFKWEEYDYGFETCKFAPAMHFFKGKDAIENSKVFKIIQMMPKGAALHVHDTSITSIDFIVKELTYWDKLYTCLQSGQIEKFRFSDDPDGTCDWILVSDLRKKLGNETVDEMIHQSMSLIVSNPETVYPDINIVWKFFENKLSVISDVTSYIPAFARHFKRAMEEFQKDNVMYFELRSELSPLYVLNGTILDNPFIVLKIYNDVAEQFIKENPDFLGVKIIYSPLRRDPQEKVMKEIYDSIKMKKMYPKLISGFDLVGQEDLGYPLLHYINELLMPSEKNIDLKYFFHAAETDWEGTSTDDNLFDAVLLNTTRIGHGYGITKHPSIMDAVKQRDIAIEVCPTSNQVLNLIHDLRNHPGTILLSDNYPVVISSDDPIIWEALPLSHDFYQAFMGLAGKKSDLRLLKQLAINSIRYSAMSLKEKEIAMKMWQKKWISFLDEVLAIH